MKKVLTLLLMLGLSFAAFAQMVDPVKFSSKLEMLKDGEAQIVFTGKIDDGWHVYSTNLGNDGPISATFNAVKMDGAEPVGKLTPKGHEISQFDNMFGMKLRFFEKSVTFVQKIKFTKPEYSINCYLEYGACNDETCMPPTEVPFTGKGKSPAVAASAEKPKVADAAAPATEEKAEEVVAETTADTMAVAAIENDSVAAVASSDSDLYRPVINELKAYEDNPVDSSLFYIFLAGFAGGFLALLTPCVWPIIPMTVSFFLKRNKERSKAIREAVTYGISIVVIYVVLGLVVTLLFGASALNALSTNAIFNIFFCLLLVVFAASFFGAFEITLPSSWSNKIDEKSENTSGLLSIFLMAFTLRTYHRIPPCCCIDPRQYSLAHNRHAWLRHSTCHSFHTLRHVPKPSQVGTEVRWLDERGKSGPRLHRACLRPEVPLRGRSCLRLAHTRPRGIPLPLDCHLRSARHLPLRLAQVSSRRP